jgi:hypothetical protein
MSRSYREPWYIDGYGSRRKAWFKNYANRVVRRSKDDIPNGKSYRKMFDQWSICDYRFRYDPHPRINYWSGVAKVIEPDPLWTINRK